MNTTSVTAVQFVYFTVSGAATNIRYGNVRECRQTEHGANTETVAAGRKSHALYMAVAEAALQLTRKR
jgi:hypothetical protein